MAHPAKPDDHDKLRSMIDQLTDDSWSGYFGNDLPFVDGEDKNVEEMLDELRRRSEDILEEFEENQSFTKPSRERREARQHAEHRIEQSRTTW